MRRRFRPKSASCLKRRKTHETSEPEQSPNKNRHLTIQDYEYFFSDYLYYGYPPQGARRKSKSCRRSEHPFDPRARSSIT